MLSNRFYPNRYADSVFLMLLSRKVAELDGIDQVSAMMATDNNKAILSASGMLSQEGEKAGPNDLLVCVKGDDAAAAERAFEHLNELLEQETQAGGDSFSFLGDEGEGPRDMDRAMEVLGGGDLAFISLPGEYAAREAMKALDRGMHVMLFSDNVSIEEEKTLKTRAAEKGLIVMGPDCGTAIINGVALGFANVVKRGPIGVVAASGTGLQAFTVLVEQAGSGISQAIGTGGRDLSAEIGGTTMLRALSALEMDSETSVIALVSKPPHPQVVELMLERISTCRKPVVVCFLGRDTASFSARGIETAATLEEAAGKCVEKANYLAGVGSMSPQAAKAEAAMAVSGYLSSWKSHQDFSARHRGTLLRGLYSGGTLCDEAIFILRDLGLDVHANIAVDQDRRISRKDGLVGNCLVDLGEDEFTVGVPHPMIDFHLRNTWIRDAIADPQTGVLLIDVVLGYGANIDPASELIPVIEEARRSRIESGAGDVTVVASVCGSARDPQGTEDQTRRLKAAGILVLSTNARAAMAAHAILECGSADFSGETHPVRNLIGRPLKVISMGLKGFCDDLRSQKIPSVHMGWRPPAGGDRKLMQVLDTLLGIGTR